jgi:hypothetical protein
MRKKIKKLIKLKKSEKNDWKNRIVKKNWLEFLKNRPVRFYKPETKKTKLKPEKTKKNQKIEKIKPNWFESVFVLK